MDLETEHTKLQAEHRHLERELKRVVSEYHKLHKKFKALERDLKRTTEERDKAQRDLKTQVKASNTTRGPRGWPIRRNKDD